MKINKLDKVFTEHKVYNRVIASYFKKHESTISLWRNNKRQPSFENLYEIARLLRVNIQDLIEPTDWKNEKSETYDEFVKRMKDE
jgi:transcriptional regulator with XRE-family HTH domain